MLGLKFVFKGIAMSCVTGLSFIVIIYTYKHFAIVLKEQYWNSASENECMIKIKHIILHIDEDFVFFSPTNLSYKLNYIYKTMRHSEKKKFREEIFQNGLQPRIKFLINDY